MKKIIIYKKDKGAFTPIDTFLKDKEKIEHAIINKQNKTKLKTLPLSINLNSFAINLKINGNKDFEVQKYKKCEKTII